jgi:hypothetical protein
VRRESGHQSLLLVAGCSRMQYVAGQVGHRCSAAQLLTAVNQARRRLATVKKEVWVKGLNMCVGMCVGTFCIDARWGAGSACVVVARVTLCTVVL